MAAFRDERHVPDRFYAVIIIYEFFAMLVLNLRGFQTASSPIGLTDSVRQSTIANFLVIGGFAAFAFVVQYVLQTIAAAND